MRRTLVRLLLLPTATASVFSGCAGRSDADLVVPSSDEAPLRVEVESEPFSVRIRSRDDRLLLSVVGVESAWNAHLDVLTPGHPWYSSVAPYIGFPAAPLLVVRSDRVCALCDVSLEGGKVTVGLGGATDLAERARLEIVVNADGTADVRVSSRGADNELTLIVEAQPDDRYFGMGMRFNSAEHKGTTVSNWVGEVGIDLPRAEHAASLGRPRVTGGLDRSYVNVPFFLSPKGYGLLLDAYEPSFFDFEDSKPDEVKVKVLAGDATFVVFDGPTPLDVIERYTARTGRIPSVPPAWAFGNWTSGVGSDQGDPKVWPIPGPNETIENLRANDVPVSAIMTEDWNWKDIPKDLSDAYWSYIEDAEPSLLEPDRYRYPDYEADLAAHHRDGVKNLSYVQPSIGPTVLYGSVRGPEYHEAEERGFLVKDGFGQPVTYDFLLGKASQVDFTIPAAKTWWQDTFFAKMQSYGVDGWMNDFGDYTPFNAQFRDGQTGASGHNAYTNLWAQAAREFWEDRQPDGDWVFFARSGSTGMARFASFNFTGDRNATYDRISGMPGNIPGLLSSGMSAHPIGSMDIGAYNCFDPANADPITGYIRPMGKRMFARWVEMGALTPIMRTHRGLYHTCNWLTELNGLWNDDGLAGHWQEQRSADAMALYKTYARLHVQFVPYFLTLAQEAQDRGWPILRHLVLHYPDDPKVYDQDYTFLVGDRVLVAPVLDDGDTRQVYLPAGTWYSWWTGEPFEGPGTYTLDAPIGELPFFLLQGKVLPLFDAHIDTLVSEVGIDPALDGWETANGSMKLVMFGDGDDSLVLWDGTKVACTKVGGQGTCEVTGGPPRTYCTDFSEPRCP
jgi:alpha-glucosidase